MGRQGGNADGSREPPPAAETATSPENGRGGRFGSPDFTFNLFPPLELIPQFVATVRDVILGSHPDVAARFVPIVDFGNGDAVGYLNGGCDPGLHRFDHESCEYDGLQDWEDFLFPIGANTLGEFLRG